MTTLRNLILALLVLTAAANPAVCVTPGFQGLGLMPSADNTHGVGVSEDGAVVTLNAWVDGSSRPGVWTASTGITVLATYGGARAVSADGSTVVGDGISQHGWRWTASGGLAMLPRLNNNTGYYATISGVSADGSVIIGEDYTVPTGVYTRAIRWTQAGGTQSLGYLPGYDREGWAQTVSPDGNTVVGSCRNDGAWSPFRWTLAGGMVPLDIPGGEAYSSDWSFSARIGRYDTPQQGHFLLWQAGVGETDLGFFQGYLFNSVTGISNDGKVIIGNSTSVGPSLGTPYVWTREGSFRPLQDMLVNECHVDMTGWRIYNVSDVSANGYYVTGTAVDAQGRVQGFVATLPEPASLTLLAAAGLAVLKRRRR